MNLIKFSIIPTATISCLLAFTPQATAQQSEPSAREKYKELLNTLTEAETDCWNAGNVANPAGVYQRYQDAYYKLINAEHTNSEEYQRSFKSKNPVYLDGCPPQKNKPRVHNEGAKSAADLFASKVFFSGGYSVVNPPQAGYGVNISNGEEFVALTDNSLTGFSVGGKITAKDSKWTLGVEYTEADGNSEAQVPTGTSPVTSMYDDVGIVYNDLSPSGSTGVALGPRGLDVQTFTEYHNLKFETLYKGLLSDISNLNVGAGIRLSGTEHRAIVTTPTFSDISSDSQQKIYDRDFYLVAKIPFDLTSLEDSSAIGLSLTPRLEAGYRNAKLESTQRNVCGLCGPADQDFTIFIEDNDNGFYIGAGLEAEAKVKVSENTYIGFRAKGWWRNNSAKIFNPENGDDLLVLNRPTFIGTDSISGATFSMTIGGKW